MEFEHGRPAVEKIIDAAISIQEHVDTLASIGKLKTEQKSKAPAAQSETPWDDLFALDAPKTAVKEKQEEKTKPEKDLLFYIMQNSKQLKDWQREILGIVRDEMLYFYPQLETKIMNEGWASYWHARIMREIDLTTDEALDFAVMHSNVIQPSRLTLNPYYLGYRMWEHIEKRWNEPKKGDREKLGLKGGEGRSKMFEIREMENDVSFIRNYLSPDLIDELDLYIYQKVGNTWQIVDKDCEKIRDNLVSRLFNCGYPYIMIEDGDHNKNGELFLRHYHEGVDLDVLYLERTLPHVYTLWGRTVHLAAVMDGKPAVYSFNGDKVTKTVAK